MIRNSEVHEYCRFRSLYIKYRVTSTRFKSLYVIQDNKYSIPVNVIVTGQVLIFQEASDKSCHNMEQVSSRSMSGVRWYMT